MVTLSNEQRDIIDAICKGDNILITGVAGTGKSFLVDYISKHYNADLTATTGKAALNINGTTVHSWSGVGTDYEYPEEIAGKIRYTKWKEDALNNIKRCNILVIDEASMLSDKLLNALDIVFRDIRNRHDETFGGIQMILIGDFLQLPPVNKENDNNKFVFEWEYWHDTAFKVFELTQVFRQENKDFVSMLNRVRNGECNQADVDMISTRSDLPIPEDVPVIRLFSTNDEADNLNNLFLSKMPLPQTVYTAIDTPGISIADMSDATDPKVKKFKYHLDKLNDNCLAPRDLALRMGAQVMLLRNIDLDARLCNGSLGIIVDMTPAGPMVKFETGETRFLEREKWEQKEGKNIIVTRNQYPLRLGWGITIHKSQGMTLDHVYCDLGKIFADGQIYVALSRCRTLDGLYIKGFNPNRIKANPAAVQFYKSLQKDLIS